MARNTMTKTELAATLFDLARDLATSNGALRVALNMLRVIEEGGSFAPSDWEANLGRIEATLEMDTPRAVAFARATPRPGLTGFRVIETERKGQFMFLLLDASEESIPVITGGLYATREEATHAAIDALTMD